VQDRDGQAQLSGVIILEADGTSIQAASGIWDSTRRLWSLDDAERSSPGEPPELIGAIERNFEFEGDPAATLTRQELLTLSELRVRQGNIAAAGGQTRQIEYEFQRRIADAFSAICFVLFAALLGVGVRERS